MDRVTQEEVENFCKHSQGILRITTRSVAESVTASSSSYSSSEDGDSGNIANNNTSAGPSVCDVVKDVLSDELYQDPLQVKKKLGLFLYMYMGAVRTQFFFSSCV